MRYTSLLIGVWILGSGLVAYIGDRIGRRMGKRRLTMLGLRPRHTAMVFTVLTGMLIAALTLSAMFFINRRVAVAMLEVEDLLARKAALESGQRALLTKYQYAEAAFQASHRRELQAERDRRAAESGLAQALRRVAELGDQVKSRLAQLHHLSAEIAGLKTELGDTRLRLTAVREELRGAKTNLREAQEQVRLTGARLKSTQDRLQLALAQAQDADRRLREAEKLQKDAEARVADLTQQISARSAELEDARKRLADTQADFRLAQTRLVSTRAELDRVQSDLDQATELFDLVRERMDVVRKEPIIFQAQEELARRVVYKPESAESVMRDLAHLLAVADATATARGAAPLAEGRTVRLVTISSPEGNQVLTEEDQVQLLASHLAQAHEDVVLRVVAAINTVRGEPVSGRLQVVPNRRVFKRGDLIAEMRIPPRATQTQVIEAVLRLLQVHVRATALEKGMLPPPSGTLGEAGWDQVLAAVRKATGRRVQSDVQVLAAADAWTADPLMVRIVVK